MLNIKVEATLPTDSGNYEVLYEGVRATSGVNGMTCEIGLRRGGGSKYIVDALVDSKQQKTHIAIDPYGNIDYAGGDGEENIRKYDYTNDMRNECLVNLYLYCHFNKVEFQFFCLEDTEFFKRFPDGVPLYREVKTVVNEYSFVHFDGPHSVSALKEEIAFFHERTPIGAVFVFDDVEMYQHSEVDRHLLNLGWESLMKSQRKWSYTKSV